MKKILTEITQAINNSLLSCCYFGKYHYHLLPHLSQVKRHYGDILDNKLAIKKNSAPPLSGKCFFFNHMQEKLYAKYELRETTQKNQIPNAFF